MDTMYREKILEHYREPLNFGKLDDFDASSKQLNPFCGDEIEMFLKWDKKDRGDRRGKKRDSGVTAFPRMTVANIGFSGTGCAICIASTSLLTEFAKGKTKSALTKFSENDMLALLGIEVSETRKKCALLGLAVLKDCIS